MRRLLMVSYAFPPSGSVAAQRPWKFARYLPEFGWEPVVVARVPDPRQPRDPSFDGAPRPALRLNPPEPSRLLGLLPGSWGAALRRFAFVPDEEAGWLAALAAALPGLLRRWRPDLLWANSVPPGSLLAAAAAAGRAGVPLALDFHNEWTRNVYYAPPTRLHDAAHRALEAFVIRRARLVTTLNPMHTEDLQARFPGARVETVENGFDPEDFAVVPPPRGGPRVFLYAGAVYGHQSPLPFLRALAETGRRDVEVRIVGDRFGQFRAGAWPFPVSVRGHVPHAELGRIFSEAHACFLCLEPPAARQLPAKLYEYLGAGRPVFAIVPGGGAADRWVRATGAGTSVDAGDPSGWARALGEFLDRLEGYRPPPAEAFHRRALTARLAAMLEAAARSVRAETHAP